MVVWDFVDDDQPDKRQAAQVCFEGAVLFWLRRGGWPIGVAVANCPRWPATQARIELAIPTWVLPVPGDWVSHY